MYLTSESSEETELSLEFEFAAGIRIAPGNTTQPKSWEEDAPDRFLEPVSEGETPGSRWKVRRDNYCATASLFGDGNLKSLSLLGDGKQSNNPARHLENFLLKPKGRVKFTSVFKLDRGNGHTTPPQYFDISPHLESLVDRWWSFRTESSSFIFRRNLETILSHAMPLPRVGGETYRPYVLHNHDLINTGQKWSSSLDQIFYLLEIDKVLQQGNTADQATKSHYRERIQKVIFGYFVWLLRHAERNGFPETVILSLSGKRAPLAKRGETRELVGEVKSEEERDVLDGPAEKSSEAEIADRAEPSGTPRTKVSPTCPGTDSPLSREAPGSASGLKTASTSHSGKSEEPEDPPPVRPFEPELSKYEDKFQNCSRFLILLDRCLTNYPKENPLITRMVEAFLKLAWEPIEMSKHRGSDLWPDELESSWELPPPYARFLNWGDYKNCGYGGQDIYIYAITTQVLVWRAVKSTKRLLNLVGKNQNWRKWTVHQSLDEDAIRDRAMEAFRLPGTDTSQKPFPDRFVSRIEGHVREPFPDNWACIIAIPSFVEDFFFDDNNKPISAWTETLKYYDKYIDSIKPQTPNTWESFIRYELAIGRSRRKLRESLEARAYSVGLFPGSPVTPDSHCPYTTAWDIVTYVLSSDHAELLYPQPRIPKIIEPRTRADGTQGSMLPPERRMSTSTNLSADISASVFQEERKSAKKGKGLDITAEDRRQVNDPPLYGERYLFEDPLFMKHKPRKFEISRADIEMFLGLGDRNSWCCFWETSKGKEKFLENIVDISDYDWGNERNAVIKPSSKGWFDRVRGREARLKLQEQRDREADRKRIIVMEDCMIEHLIFLMANLDFQEASHISEFLSRLRHMGSHEMRFAEQTIMPDNLWITEFNINFITAPPQPEVESPHPPNYFPRRREKFLSMKDVAPAYIMAEAAMGFRIIGDLHDRYWTCYVFCDFGNEELKSGARTQVTQSGYGLSSSQRKCLEGFLVCQALDLVLSETRTILDIITKSTRKSKKSGAIFKPLLTEDDLSGKNYFKTMNKNSAFYPWLLELYGSLQDKCNKSRRIAEQWISAEKTREHKPRWSEKDQKRHGKEVAKNRADVKARCTELEEMAGNIQERIDRIKTRKESLSSELALREARTSTQLAHSVNLFTIVTITYLPLTFSTSLVAIQDFHWSSPAKALVRIALPVTFGTIILLMNLAFLRRNFAALKTWAQRSVRQRMARAPERKGSSKEPIYREKRPAWNYWKERARGLREAEKRSTLLADNSTHDNESNWWYWYFMAIFIIIVVPVQELTFIIRTLRLQKVEKAGPLKKFVRLPWAPIWVLQLVLVYVIMLTGYSVLSLAGLAHRAAVWLWTGDDIAEDKEAAQDEVEESLMSQLEGDEEILESEPDSAQKDKGFVGWLKKPAKTMHFYIIGEALQRKKKEEQHDEEKQGTTVEDPESRSSI
ncbi:hypothetical protein HOY80DRAFT_929088 [Tuber brumale]|nr:hypothetical protein HOY80DRAFT_929088 [Tuber brumale]